MKRLSAFSTSILHCKPLRQILTSDTGLLWHRKEEGGAVLPDSTLSEFSVMVERVKTLCLKKMDMHGNYGKTSRSSQLDCTANCLW